LQSKKNQFSMKKLTVILGLGIILLLGCTAQKQGSNSKRGHAEMNTNNMKDENQMKLGAFSMSLNVKDLKASKEFYESLGFSTLGGDMARNYLIMKNGNAIIGLFQGMFEGNIITFNPGWDENGQNFDPYDDIRKIQKQLKEKGIQLDLEADESTKGPASIMLKDPDGNLILFDQHR
jgi:catechol 2,3-dioxygenase-like lactoylglutathione lyase family enzyme